MRSFLADRDVNLRVDFYVDGEPVSPTTDTVQYSLFGQDGAVVSGQSSVSVATGEGDTSVSIPIAAAYNAIAEGNDFERRTLLVWFDVDGQSLHQQLTYRIHPLLNTSATPASVRAMLGVSASELPDSDIDIAGAFYELRDDLTDGALVTALATGSTLAASADEAIAATAALAVFPSLRLRALQSKESDGSSASRFAKVDWTAVQFEISNRRSDLMRAINGATGEELALAVKTADTDLFGGA